MSKIKRKKIAVLVSGGVDSAVALALLKKEGHDVTAFYLKIWLEDELAHLGSCPWEEDLAMVHAVCEKVGAPLQIVSLQQEYWDEVVRYTVEEIRHGHTPNPDMLCNQRVKFGKFYDKIDASFEKVATGHYAGVEEKGGKFWLKRSPDPIKDQTYFLSYLSQKQLGRAAFPLCPYTKKEVRELAHDMDLPNQARKDSQGICFLGKIPFSEFVKHHLGEKTGDLIEMETGKKIGEHQGFWYYTIGQRHGLDLSGGPWFVAQKDIKKNIVYISKNYHSEDKKRDHCAVRDFNWIGYEPQLNTPLSLKAKMRHGERFYDATATFSDLKTGTIKLNASDQGLAPGQFAALYDGEYCVGSGVQTPRMERSEMRSPAFSPA
ncbi:MAG: tRNA 2-thiouridine(34) synthase MnmA [Candidatus Gracilibacteria bacterium]